MQRMIKNTNEPKKEGLRANDDADFHSQQGCCSHLRNEEVETQRGWMGISVGVPQKLKSHELPAPALASVQSV